MFVFLFQRCPPPSPLMRHVRPMSGPLPSPHALESSGFSLNLMRVTVAKASKFHMLPMMVREFHVTNFDTSFHFLSEKLA